LAILAPGIGLPTKTACEPWKSEKVKKIYQAAGKKACGFFYLKKNLN
jgi:hypothetical protein|tara:strand:- start:1033 stop:1173 length:141 start_codon:yes stop_codon:yes gene_type:complete